MSAESIPIPKFALGQSCITPAALEQLTHQDVLRAIQRHQAGDWGDLDEHDRQENEFSLKEGFRLFSVYHSAQGVKFYVITEADREITTVLLPEDY
jgi:hypothetical protein